MVDQSKVVAPIMVLGTGKNPDYYAVAYKHGYVLSVKILGMRRGAVSGTTYLGIKIRSAEVPDNAAWAGEASPKVIDLAAAKAKPDSVWPGVKFDRVDELRASVDMGVFLSGDMNHNPKELGKSLTSIDVAAKIVGFLVKAAEGGTPLYAPATLLSIFSREMEKIAKAVLDQSDLQQQTATVISKNVGVFGTESDLLKAIYAGLTKSPPAVDAESETEADNDEDDSDTD